MNRLVTTEPRLAENTADAVIYLRVPTREQAERGGETEGFSIPAQRAACLRKAEALGTEVVSEFVDAGESARSSRRPQLQAMLAFLAEHPTRYVIVHKVDRLARAPTALRSAWRSVVMARRSSPSPRASTRRPRASCCTAS